jgi:hypothetical protein
MYITSSDNTTKKISFQVQVARLLDAIMHTDIELGTSAKPIPIDSFVTIKDADSYTFYSDETITFQLISVDNSEGLLLDLVACDINNIGQDFNKRFVTIPDPWKNIFDSTPDNILELPDGSLSIKPVENVCAITVAKGLKDTVLNTYVSYKVIFKSTITVTNREGKDILRTFYFVIDPLIKITSGGRGGGTF